MCSFMFFKGRQNILKPLSTHKNTRNYIQCDIDLILPFRFDFLVTFSHLYTRFNAT